MSSAPSSSPPHLADLESSTALAAIAGDKLDHVGEAAASALDRSLDASVPAGSEPAVSHAPQPSPAGRHLEAAGEPAVTTLEAVPPMVPPPTPEGSSAPPVQALAAFNGKALEAMRANVAATVQFWGALSGARSLSDVIALGATYARRQMEAGIAQSRDVSELARTMWAEVARPVAGTGGERPTDPREP